MALTMQEALTSNEFHDDGLCAKCGMDKNGHSVREFRNGTTKTWKTRPGEFRIPVKFGFRGPYGYITQDTANFYHSRENCPNCQH